MTFHSILPGTSGEITPWTAPWTESLIGLEEDIQLHGGTWKHRVHIYMSPGVRELWLCVYIYMYTWTNAYVYIYIYIYICVCVFNTIRSDKYSKLYVADSTKGRQAADHTCTVSSPGTAQSDATQKCCSKCSSQCRCLYGLLDIYCLSDMYILQLLLSMLQLQCSSCLQGSTEDQRLDERHETTTRIPTWNMCAALKILYFEWSPPYTRFWHSFWHTIWKYLWLLYSDTLPGILSDIYSDILSDMQLRSSSADWDLQLDCQGGEGRTDGLTSDKI